MKAQLLNCSDQAFESPLASLRDQRAEFIVTAAYGWIILVACLNVRRLMYQSLISICLVTSRI